LLSFVLPKIEREASARNFCRFVIGPLEGGFGTTLGNALRRVLLSFLPGAAVTALRITDVSHEFSAIPHVKEDTTWLILNMKQLRFRVDDDVETPLNARIEVRGEGPVTGGDIICPPGLEVVNPDIVLLTADSSDADLDIDLTVQRGRGYLSTDDREGNKMPLGEIPVDAIFTPVRRVRYNVERARIAQQSGYEKLVLEIQTDGTTSPEDALREGAQLLVQHLVLITGVEAVMPPGAAEEQAIPSGLYSREIEALGLNVRVYNCLRRAGITTVAEVLESLAKGDDELLAIRNFGTKSLDELKERLEEMGLRPAGKATEARVAAEVAPGADRRQPMLASADNDLEKADGSAEVLPEAAELEIPGFAMSEGQEPERREEPSEADEDEGLRLDEQLAAALRRAMMGGAAD
jgi:DNA-directed RNA polymerase subunit alpha